jgi:hypothetical protein
MIARSSVNLNRRGLGFPSWATGGDGAAFDEAETQFRQAAQSLAVLVQPGRQTDRIGQPQTRDRRGQNGIVGGRLRQGDRLQGPDRKAVRGLGIQPAQQGGADIGDAAHARIISPSAETENARFAVTDATERGP